MELRSRKKGSGPGSSSAGSIKGKEIYVSSSSDADSLSDGTSDESFVDEIVIDDNDCSSDYGVVDEEKAPKRRREKSKSKYDADAMLSDAEDSLVAEQAYFGVPLDQPLPTYENRINNKRRRRGRRSSKSKEILLWEIWEDENDDWIDENLTLDTDLDSQNGFAVETADAPSDLIIPLLRYQKEWLAWALNQEGSEIKGGILADEMGMGKTAQAIALVLAERQLMGQSTSSGSSSNLSGTKTTLVVCPVVAVSQWVSEVDHFTSKGSTSVLVYHGACRERDIEQFSKYDFVITTYSTIEAEFRKCMMPPKETCDYCGKKFNEDKLRVHLKYFCGPDATRTDKQSKQQRKKGKFVKEQVTKNDKNCVDDKANRRKRAHIKSNKENDSFQSNVSLKEKSVLHSVKWNRIILDEAHYIKDRRSNTAKAIFALESSYKWALSGTPLQNRVGELYSLIRFLQVVPYSFYLCKDCDCRTLDHRTSTVCSSCPHNAVRHFCWWNRYITNPVQASANSEEGRRAMILLRHKVLKNILLRRTKEGRAADLALPPRIVSLRRDTLDVKEEDYYESLYNESQALFNTYVNAGTVMNNYAHIFDLLTRLRQAVDHPYLVVYSKRNDSNSGNSTEFNDVEQDCGICHEPLEDRVVTSCAHVFCKACLLSYASSLGQVSCPSCSKLLTVDWTSDGGDKSTKATIKGFNASSILNRLQLNDFQTSTKIEALREEIRFMFERDGSAKGIVFSQFTQFLDLIGYCLQKSGISCVQLVGSMSFGARVAAIKKFNEDPDCKIFLIGLKAGGVALNLTIASHVFMMDPWWNPAVERQAQDRIHRIGQFKPIRIVRFVIENTVEERILHLQQKKELVFEGTVGGSSKALGKLTEADMRFLFAS